jgi:hypothetical protein
MKKHLILICTCLMLFAGVSCKKEGPQTPPPEKSTTPQSGQQQPEKQPEATASNLPVLQAAVQIMSGAQPLTIGHTASPEIVDWNNDGKKDLILGTYLTFPNPIEEGKVMLYLNQGTDEAPVFKEGRYLQAAGQVISVGAG